MNSSDTVEFRLPARAVRRAFLQHTAVLAAILVVFHLVTRQSSFAALAGAAALVAAILLVAYAFSAQRVWFRASARGLAATGYTGRELEIPWSTAVRVSPARRSGQKGHSVVALENAGMFSSGLHSIFIPRAIAESPESSSVSLLRGST